MRWVTYKWSGIWGVLYFVEIKMRVTRLLMESTWIILGQGAVVIGSLVLVRVLTEYLTPSQYGELALGLTIAGAVNQVVMCGLIGGIGRFYSIAAEQSDLGRYLKASGKLMAYATIGVVAIFMVLLLALYLLKQTYWVGISIAALSFSALEGYKGVLRDVQNAARQRVLVALHLGMDACLKICICLVLIVTFGASATAVIIGYGISALLVTISQILFLRRHVITFGKSDGIRSGEDWGSQIWAFSWPFSVWGLFTWAQQVSDRWALDAYVSTQEVGQYFAVYQLGYGPIGMVTGFMMTLVIPVLYQRAGRTADDNRNLSVHQITWRMTIISLLVTGMAFLFVLMLHDWLFAWLVAPAFRSVSFYLPWIVLAGGIFSSGQMLSIKLMSEMRTKKLIQLKIGTAIIGIIANISGVCFFGVPGAVVGLLIFSVSYLVWLVFLAISKPPSSLVAAN